MSEGWGYVVLLILLGAMGFGVIGGGLGLPFYNVWSSEMDGKAQLAEAEYSKKVAIETAKADLESAGYYAESEIERAKGVAEANKIIGDSLQGNEAYLRYLWIQGLKTNEQQIVYVPTEAGLPVLEATRNLEIEK